MPDTHDEIFQFIIDHPDNFDPKDINGFVNYLHNNPERWQRTKQWVITKTAPPPEASRRAPRNLSDESKLVAETVRTMKSMFQAGATVEEINERVPCWVDESGWSEESIGIIVGTNPPMNWSFLKRMG